MSRTLFSFLESADDATDDEPPAAAPVGDDLALEAAPPMIINGDDSGRCCHARARCLAVAARESRGPARPPQVFFRLAPALAKRGPRSLDRYCAAKEERHYSMVSGWAMVFRALNMKFLHLIRPFSTIRQRRVSKCVVVWSII